MSPFEVYEAPAGRRGEVPTVRFLSAGRIHFNAAAGRMLDGYTHLRLLWDAEDLRVGFEPTDESDKLGYKLTQSPSQTVMTAAGFADRYRIGSQKMRLEREDEMFVAEIPPALA
jgi:hypothetical protein